MKLPQIVIILGITIASASLQAQSPARSSAISVERIKSDVRVLSSDEFLGRGPGERGEEKAIKYIADTFATARLEPAGDDGTWFQAVPLVRMDRPSGAV
jgi:hypothetical protein